MSVKKRIKQLIKTFDLFSHPVSFRYNDQPSYETLTGGIVSVLLAGIFIGVFMGTTINTLNKVYIKSQTRKFVEESPSIYSTTSQGFMFAIGITQLDMNQGERYFDVYMQFRHYNSSGRIKQKFPLQPCQRSQWSDIDLQLGNTYDRLGFKSWLCPTPGLLIEVEGKFTSEVFKFWKIAVTKCDQDLYQGQNRSCVSDQKINDFLKQEEAFNFNFYFINTLLNPDSKVFTNHYLEDANYFPFSITNGVNANLFISSYTINTDDSIYPFEEKSTQKGGIVTTTAQMLNYGVQNNEYIKFYLRKSPISIDVERQFRKVDDTLSYIGGLFSAIIAVMGIMNLYTEFSYELQIAKNIYYFNHDDPLDADQFNFLTYLGYLIYMGLDKFNIQLPWKSMERYHRCLEEVRKQIDMRLIMKKILYSERLSVAVLDQEKAKVLHLQQPLTFGEAQQIRKDHRFYKNYRKKYFPKGIVLTQQGQKFMDAQEANKFDNKGNKIHPQCDDSFIMMKSKQSQNVSFQTYNSGSLSHQNHQNPKIIKREEQILQMSKDMQKYLSHVKIEAARGDPTAMRIWNRIDERVKQSLKIKGITKNQRKLNSKIKEGPPLQTIEQFTNGFHKKQ